MSVEPPLYIDRYAPDIDGLLQQELQNMLTPLVGSNIDLILSGRRGVGKTAAARALANETHGSSGAIIHLHGNEFFDQSKDEIVSDSRWSHLFDKADKRENSKSTLLIEVIRRLSENHTADGRFQTIIVDNAESMRDDFQAALRRVMEQYGGSTQFIFTTRSISRIIDPIAESRCNHLAVPSPPLSALRKRYRTIADDEGIEYTDEGIGVLASVVHPNIRAGLIVMQKIASDDETISPDTVPDYYDVQDLEGRLDEVIDLIENEQVKEARETLHELFHTQGYAGEYLYRKLAERLEYHSPNTTEVATLAADIDAKRSRGSSVMYYCLELLLRHVHGDSATAQTTLTPHEQ